MFEYSIYMLEKVNTSERSIPRETHIGIGIFHFNALQTVFRLALLKIRDCIYLKVESESG